MIVVAKATPTTSKIAKDTPRMTSLKDARDVVEDGGCTIWGQIPDIPYKSDKFGMGFTAEAQRVFLCSCARRPSFHVSNNGVKAIEDADNDYDLDRWIFPTISNGLSNWKTVDLI